ACTAGTASRAMIVNTKDFITTPLRFSDALFAGSPYAGGSPADVGLPYDFGTTSAAAGESGHPLRPVALIFVGADREAHEPPNAAPSERQYPPWTGPAPSRRAIVPLARIVSTDFLAAQADAVEPGAWDRPPRAARMRPCGSPRGTSTPRVRAGLGSSIGSISATPTSPACKRPR